MGSRAARKRAAAVGPLGLPLRSGRRPWHALLHKTQLACRLNRLPSAFIELPYPASQFLPAPTETDATSPPGRPDDVAEQCRSLPGRLAEVTVNPSAELRILVFFPSIHACAMGHDRQRQRSRRRTPAGPERSGKQSQVLAGPL